MRRILQVVALTLLFGATRASAGQPPVWDFRPAGPGNGVAVWGIVGDWGDGLGFGARYVMPLVPDGFLHGAVPAFKKDSLEVEVGFDYVYYSWDYWGYDWSWNVLRPAVGAKWSIWLNDQFAFYPKLEFGFDIAWYSNSDWGPYAEPESHTGVYFDGGAGILFRLAPALDLRAELGIDGLRAGVAFNF